MGNLKSGICPEFLLDEYDPRLGVFGIVDAPDPPKPCREGGKE